MGNLVQEEATNYLANLKSINQTKGGEYSGSGKTNNSS